MRKLKYILMFMLTVVFLNSCLVDDSTDYDLNDTGKNVVTFNLTSSNLSIPATGLEQIVSFDVKISGPSVKDLKNDITFTVAANSSATAVAETHYRIVTSTVTLKKSDNYLGKVQVAIITAGNAPLEEGDLGYEEWLKNYKAPVMVLDITSATGEENAINSGKSISAKINYVSFCFFAGVYDLELIYRHPAYGTYPNNIYGDNPRVYEDFELTALSSKKCEMWFGVWGPDDLMSITINPSTYLVTEIVRYAGTVPSLGDPYDATKISHYDPVDGKIYLYYHYSGAATNGDPYRIFWNVLTPKF